MSPRRSNLFIFPLTVGIILSWSSLSFTQPSSLNKGWLQGSWQSFTTANGLSSDMVLSIAVEGRYVWFGTYAGGASCLNKETGQWTSSTTKWQPGLAAKTKSGFYWENTLEDNHVTAIAVDPDGGVWFGTTFYGRGDVLGVSHFVRHPSARWTVYGQSNGILCNDITCLAIDPDSVWVGTQKGLARYAKKDRTWTFLDNRQQLSDLYINTMVIDGPDVWIGTGVGITVFNKTTKTWKTITVKDGLPEEPIQAIAVEEGHVWVGGTYGGIAVLDKDKGVWQTIRTGDGLDDLWIKNMANDGRNIWVARDGGVSCYHIATGKWQALTALDGLVDNHVNAVAVDGSAIWFGTSAGVSRLTLK
jgi:ligand-binding sensor domain-containing protein